SVPIDALRLDQRELWRPFGENHQVAAGEPGIGNSQPIEPKEIGRRGNRLGRCVIEAAIPSNIDPERSQAGGIREAQVPLGLYLDGVNLVLDPARPDRLKRKAITDFGKRAVAHQAGVENLKLAACTPPPMSRGASQRLPAASGHSPYGAAKRFRVEGLQGIENDAIMDARRSHRQVRPSSGPVIVRSGHRQVYVLSSRPSMTDSTSAVRPSWIRSIARAPFSSEC